MSWLSTIFGDPDKPYVSTSVKDRWKRQLPITTPQDPLLVTCDEAEAQVNSTGRLKPAAELVRASLRDGQLRGLLQARTGGLVALPALYGGSSKVAARKLGKVGEQGVSLFDQQIRPSELATFLQDAIMLGTGVGQLVDNGDRKIFVRRRPDPMRWIAGRWTYAESPIEPGDGAWVVGSIALESPWQQGAWIATTRSTTAKLLAKLNLLNYIASLANGALNLDLPPGVSQSEVQDAIDDLREFAASNVYATRAGFKLSMLESSNAVGVAAFKQAIDEAKESIAIEISGQSVLQSGAGGAFQNLSVFERVTENLIIADATFLNGVIDEQIMPFLAEGVTRVIDLTDDGARVVKTQSWIQAGTAIKGLQDVFGERLDTDQISTQLAIPLKESSDKPEAPPPQALNGAQVTSLVNIVVQVALGQLPRDAAINVIKLSYSVDDATATAMLGSAGDGFVPAPLPGDAPAPAPAPADDSGDDSTDSTDDGGDGGDTTDPTADDSTDNTDEGDA